jgi:hypothetical protein
MAKLIGSLALYLGMLICALPAAAQGFSPPPGSAGKSQACVRLEAQLSAVDRGTADPARAEQIRRYEEAANKQQVELDRIIGQSRRVGCEGLGFFSLFGGQPPQCSQLNVQIQQMRGNLDRILSDIEQMQGGTAQRESQRRALFAALAQNDCGPQYRSAAVQPRGFFDSLFGPGSIVAPQESYQSSTYRTVCVRTCDGYYFPISFSTNPSRFQDDERTCQRMCPAAEVQLFSYRNPGEEMAQAVSASGQAYGDLPTAFKYRQEVNRACSCKRPGQSWGDALKNVDDNTVERGDIVVTDERAKQLSQPKVDAQGRPQRIDPRTGKPAAAQAPAAAAPASAEEKPEEASSEKRKVRSVGPTFLPVR